MNQLEQHFINENFEEFKVISLELLANEDTLEASRKICDVFVKHHNVANAEIIAEILESIFKDCSALVENLKAVENPFLLMVIFTGSEKIYQAYTKCYLDPFISQLDENEIMDYYLKLYTYCEETIDLLLENYQTVFKGKDYNGKMIGINESTDFVMLPSKDYYLMEQLIENYNKILGRRNIFKDVTERYENC